MCCMRYCHEDLTSLGSVMHGPTGQLDNQLDLTRLTKTCTVPREH